MSSGPCPDCFSGTVSEGMPTGTISTIHNLPTYVTTPEDDVKPNGLVIVITDAFGYKLVNNQVLADQYAKKGSFLVYVPDFMGGKLPPNPIHVPQSTSKPKLTLSPAQATQWTSPA
jgi:dienelactone hydrolase